MSVLKQKLDKAAQLFQTHHFKEALASYDDCIAFSYRAREAQSLIFNIMTTKAALQSILGETDRSMNTLNEVLRTDPNHYLALIRRSQVYKKKGKFNRALKDLELVSAFCPDNLQVTAMKLEIETMKSKNKNSNSSDESESEDEFDEEIQLNFSNLKKIDRKSCSILVSPFKAKGRQSRVTISGDTTVEYESEYVYDKSNNSTSAGKETNQEKYLKTFKELESQNDIPAPATNIVAKPSGRSKSILKNRLTSIVEKPEVKPVEQKENDNYGGRESRFNQIIKNIDGKMISSNNSIGSDKGIREVEFRKSLFASQAKDFVVEVTPATVKPKVEAKRGARKSCMKPASCSGEIDLQVKKAPIRKSKFDTMPRNSIDGVVIKNRKSIDGVKGLQNNIDKCKGGDSDEEEGSSYNIYGSQENLVISNEVKEKLGLKDEVKGAKSKGPQRAGGGKSILKKNSVLINVEPEKKKEVVVSTDPEASQSKATPKAKKSVMFTKSRFAQE